MSACMATHGWLTTPVGRINWQNSSLAGPKAVAKGIGKLQRAVEREVGVPVTIHMRRPRRRHLRLGDFDLSFL